MMCSRFSLPRPPRHQQMFLCFKWQAIFDENQANWPVEKDAVESEFLIGNLQFRLDTTARQLDQQRLRIFAVTSHQRVFKLTGSRRECPNVQHLQRQSTNNQRGHIIIINDIIIIIILITNLLLRTKHQVNTLKIYYTYYYTYSFIRIMHILYTNIHMTL